jgi:hypothetical protein
MEESFIAFIAVMLVLIIPWSILLACGVYYDNMGIPFGGIFIYLCLIGLISTFCD